MIDAKKWDQVLHLLYWNPWSTVNFLSAMSGISGSTVRRRLKRDRGIEEIAISNQFGKKLKVFALKRRRQLNLMGLNMHPTFMAEALMMSFARLRLARDMFGVLHRSGLTLSWIASPWRPGMRGSLFDGLVKVDTSGGKQMLLAVVCRFQDLNALSYEFLLKAWVKWRKKAPGHPASLVFFDPNFSVGAAKRLQDISAAVSGDVVCYLPATADPDRRWVYLNTKGLSPIAVPPWGRGAGKPQAYFSALPSRTFHKGVRKTRYPHAETIAAWLETNKVSEACELTSDYLSMKPIEVEMFRWLLLFPAMDRETYAVLSNINAHSHYNLKNYKNIFAQTTTKLQKENYVIETQAFPGHHALTPKGLRFFSLIAGLNPDEMAGAWGHPERVGKFSFQQKHQTLVLKIIRQMALDGDLIRVGTESNRLIFYDIRRFSKKIRRIEIRPDVIATIRHKNKFQTYWIEVDRGTRKGKNIYWKLQKLFYIFFARKSPTPIMPVVFVVDCENGSNESRVRYILKLLKKLYVLFPQTPLHLLITTADLLDQIPGTFVRKQVWREFYLGQVNKRTRSLEEIFSKNSGSGASIGRGWR